MVMRIVLPMAMCIRGNMLSMSALVLLMVLVVVIMLAV